MPEPTVLESLLMAVTHVFTLLQENQLTNAIGFLFERDGRLFLITSRHVVLDANTQHRPDRLPMELHTDPTDLTVVNSVTLPLYRDGQALWRRRRFRRLGGCRRVGEFAQRITRERHAARIHTRPYRDRLRSDRSWHRGADRRFPLGFHGNVHHLPVARQAVIASAFGIRFQGPGCCLTDALLHCGISGAPVMPRTTDSKSGDLPWILVGVHASGTDVTNRDAAQDERLSLNCAWYADVIFTLTEDSPAQQPADADH